MSLKSCCLIKSIFLGIQTNKEEITSLIQEKLNKQIKNKFKIIRETKLLEKKSSM